MNAEILDVSTETFTYTIESSSIQIAKSDVITNLDGSLTFFNPKLLINGNAKSLGSWAFSKDSQRGFCTLLGKELVSAKARSINAHVDSYPTLPTLHKDGRVENQVSTSITTSIICK